jgi:hypothetical protein
MLHLLNNTTRLCDGLSRREALRAGGLGALGLSLPQLLRMKQLQASESDRREGTAKNVILFWLLGGPPQHETWDPKPNAAANVRGEFTAIPTKVPGFHVGELMPLTAQLTDRIAALRAVVSSDNAHSSSGYQMHTGVQHQPRNRENATPKAPNLWPSINAIVRKLQPDKGIPSAITLPRHIANDGEIMWPGQDAGFMGRQFDPWLVTCDPAKADFDIPDLALPNGMDLKRIDARRGLLQSLDQHRRTLEQAASTRRFTQHSLQAFDMLTRQSARDAFRLSNETDALRDRYGRDRFGQSVLLSRRLIEAGTTLVQVNWTRVAGETLNNGTWDTHASHCKALSSFLMPMMDRTFSALIEDLTRRGLLDETLVVWIGEFGHTPRINARAGRDHWGNCFSVAMAGGGIKGGVIHGASDPHAAYPISGRVEPRDITATIFHCLGFDPETLVHDNVGRPFPISRGRVISEILA